jgi:hypothetical protein
MSGERRAAGYEAGPPKEVPMRHRPALLLVPLLLGVVLACFPSGLADAGRREPIVLQVGDVVRIKGTNIECAVARRKGAPLTECFASGRRAGTYGTLLGARDVLVVRFATPALARTVFETRQRDPNFTTCR